MQFSELQNESKSSRSGFAKLWCARQNKSVSDFKCSEWNSLLTPFSGLPVASILDLHLLCTDMASQYNWAQEATWIVSEIIGNIPNNTTGVASSKTINYQISQGAHGIDWFSLFQAAHQSPGPEALYGVFQAHWWPRQLMWFGRLPVKICFHTSNRISVLLTEKSHVFLNSNIKNDWIVVPDPNNFSTFEFSKLN